MSDEPVAGRRNDALPDKVLPPRERRARREFSSSRASGFAPAGHQQQGVREFVAIDRRDLYAFPVPPARLLQEYFKLTPAETRLAQLIARAEPIEGVACALGIKLCTARSQLAAIFEKTGTARQPELVALLSRLAHMSQWRAGRAAL